MRQTLGLEPAAIAEFQPGSMHEIDDGARDADLAGTRDVCKARAEIEDGPGAGGQIALADVHAAADRDARPSRHLDDRRGAADGTAGSVERCDEISIPCGQLAAPPPRDLALEDPAQMHQIFGRRLGTNRHDGGQHQRGRTPPVGAGDEPFDLP